MRTLPDTIDVSLREAFSVVERALAGIGLPSGCTLDAARMVVALEIEAGTGLGLLDQQVSGLPLTPLNTPKMLVEADAYALVGASAESSLYVGPPALDLVCSKASDEGVAAVVMEGATGASFGPGLISYARHRGFDALLSVQVPDVDGQERFAIVARGHAIAAMDGVATSLLDALEAVANNDRVANGSAGRRASPPLAVESTLTLICTPTSAVGSRRRLGGMWSWSEARGYGPFLVEDGGEEVDPRTISTREQIALHDGLTVDQGIWTRLCETNTGILATISEGSRDDAGPGTGRPLTA